MKNPSDNSLACLPSRLAACSMLAALVAILPGSVQAQTAGYYTQNGGVVWYGAQQQPAPNRHHAGQAGSGYYPAPAYIQHPAYSQPAVRGVYPPGSYAANANAANAAAANRYGGTTAWTQPGFVAQPYPQNSAYGVPQQNYGYYQTAPAYGHPQNQNQAYYGQRNPYPGYGYQPPTGYPSYNPTIAGQDAYGRPVYSQPGQPQANQAQPMQALPNQGQPNQGQFNQGQPPQNPHAHNQLTPVQQAARQAATNIAPNGAPVLSPAAQKFFQNLQGPNRTTFNQNQQNYSHYGQTQPSHQIPNTNTTWQSGSRFGQTYSNRSTFNQSRANQNGFNNRLRNLTSPGLRGY